MDISEEVDGDIVQRFGEVMRLAREHLSASERLRIVEESFAGKMSVQDVARRNGVSRGQLNEWRRALRDAQAEAFLRHDTVLPHRLMHRLDNWRLTADQ